MAQVKSRYSRNYRDGWDQIWNQSTGAIIKFPVPVDAVVIGYHHSYLLIFLHIPVLKLKVSLVGSVQERLITLEDNILYYNTPNVLYNNKIDFTGTYYLLKGSIEQLKETVAKKTFSAFQYGCSNWTGPITGGTLKEALSFFQKITIPNVIKHLGCSVRTHFCKGTTAIHANTCRKFVKHIDSCNCKDQGFLFHSSICKHFDCQCPCECNCCKKTCRCVCSCACCTNTCLCPCLCDTSLAAKHYLEKFKLNTSTISFGLHDYNLNFYSTPNIEGLFRDKKEIGIACLNNQDWIISSLDTNTSISRFQEFTQAGITIRD